MNSSKIFDVIIIGGSNAGLSSAMALGRSLRNVLVIDAGKPCNAPTPHSHNFLTQDGSTPAEISRIGKEQVSAYQTVQFLDDLAITASKTDTGFEITTQSGKHFESKKLILATGIKDELLPISGFEACWGISVIHCPYCHGYEFRGQQTGILANGEMAFHLAGLVKNLTPNLTILTNGKADFTEDLLAKLSKNNIEIIEKAAIEVIHEQGNIKALKFGDGSAEPFDAVYAKLPFTHHTDIASQLNLEFNEGGYIKVNPMNQTSLAGVYAVGDNANPMRSVATAVYTGNFAGAFVNKELVEEEF